MRLGSPIESASVAKLNSDASATHPPPVSGIIDSTYGDTDPQGGCESGPRVGSHPSDWGYLSELVLQSPHLANYSSRKRTPKWSNPTNPIHPYLIAST
jgi:hypothetical protein